jgi:NAD(P)-dependent dehydrogenase (short-subunit alcohol dehydrogenase family)
MRVLVTGASTGLGLGAAAALVSAGHEVVAHVRNASSEHADDPRWLATIAGDLADAEQTRTVAAEANEIGGLDAVIHSAGVYRSGDEFAVNVLGPFLLTSLIDAPGRLVYLSSGLHRSGSTDLTRIESGRVTYSDSKLYVTALALEIAERWRGTASHAVDPGWVPTRMGGRSAPDDLVEGHETQVWLATANDIVPATGGYWHHRRLEQPHPAAQDAGFRSELIDRLEQVAGVSLGGGVS